jgi:hypothetical protein
MPAIPVVCRLSDRHSTFRRLQLLTDGRPPVIHLLSAALTDGAYLPVTCCYRAAAGDPSSPHEMSEGCNTIVAILSSSSAEPLALSLQLIEIDRPDEEISSAELVNHIVSPNPHSQR